MWQAVSAFLQDFFEHYGSRPPAENHMIGACRTADTSIRQASGRVSSQSCAKLRACGPQESFLQCAPANSIPPVVETQASMCSQHVHACAIAEQHQQHCRFGGGGSHSVQSLETLVAVVAGALNGCLRQGQSKCSRQIDQFIIIRTQTQREALCGCRYHTLAGFPHCTMLRRALQEGGGPPRGGGYLLCQSGLLCLLHQRCDCRHCSCQPAQSPCCPRHVSGSWYCCC